MSSFIKDWYYCIDDFFWQHNYWYVKMNEEEIKVYNDTWWWAWELLEYSSLKWRWWNREVLRNIPKK